MMRDEQHQKIEEDFSFGRMGAHSRGMGKSGRRKLPFD